MFTWHDGTNAHSNLDFTGTTVLTAVRSTTQKSSLEKNVHRPRTSCTHRFLADQKEIIIFANRQNFSIEMFAGNVAIERKKGGPPGAILDRSSVQNRSCEVHFQIRPL